MVVLTVGSFISVFLMICVFTFLYKENPVYRIAEHIMVGAAAGYYLVNNLDFIMKSGVGPALSGRPQYFLALLIGLLLFSNLIPKYAWLSRYGLALITGSGIGLAVSTVIVTNGLRQIEGAVAPVLTAVSAFDWFNVILSVVLTISVIYFFTYTTKVRPKALNPIQLIGRLGLMISFGVGYGQTTSYRLNLIIGRVDALLEPSIRMYSLAMIVVLMGIVLYWDYKKTG